MSFWAWLFGKREPETPKEPATFEQWFDAQGFRNFKGKEIARYFKRSQNTYPPRALWPNIVPTLRIVDDLRDHLGKPIRITSSYRSPEYNAKVGGATSSYHKRFMAMDIQCDGATPDEVYDVLSAWRAQGRFTGGLGRYATFVHIDTRRYNATW